MTRLQLFDTHGADYNLALNSFFIKRSSRQQLVRYSTADNGSDITSSSKDLSGSKAKPDRDVSKK